MRSFECLRLAYGVFLTFSANHPALSQPLAVNPSAAASDVRNPSSTNPAAAASDVRTPSATNPSAAASQIPQPTAASPSRTNVTPPISGQRIAPPPRRARAIEQTRQSRSKPRGANTAVEMTRPFEALEGARRDRMEFEKRAAQEKSEQRRMEKQQKVKQAAENRSEAAAKRAQGARPAGTSVPSETTPSSSPAGPE
jgi:hypothetical protein